MKYTIFANDEIKSGQVFRPELLTSGMVNNRKRLKYLLLFAFGLAAAVLVIWLHSRRPGPDKLTDYTGSQSCRPCHEKFYSLWSGSHHDLAMQPVTGEMLMKNRFGEGDKIKVGDRFYLPVVAGDSLFITEYSENGDSAVYRAIHAMGGKYVYYFLTLLDGGRLQVLPLAYDLKTSEWYDNPHSGVRHFENLPDAALEWKSYPFTFNTSCYSCHVSQLTTNYNAEEMTYRTEWREQGINCETCHGPAEEHIRVFSKSDSGEVISDIKIISTKLFTAEQHNSSCGSCHAKMIPIASSFTPGEYFYKAFDLVTPENPDFYPDGRDLGENYTYSSWEMNECKESSNLNCVSCHTSSGRYRFRDNPDDACMPCHESRVRDPRSHTGHDPAGAGGRCVACHMPKTTFARMERSDHSFRPPAPAATIEFGSPNACNICHTDKSARWANSIVIKERGNYQDELIQTGRLMKEARTNHWQHADIISEGIINEKFNHLFAAAFIRLADTYNFSGLQEAIISAAESKSPLVRAAAAHAMTFRAGQQRMKTLLVLAADSVALVRINAGYAFSTMSAELIPDSDTALVSGAIRAYAGSLVTRNDQWGSWYNLGNFYAGTGDPGKAAESYEMAVRIFPGATAALVNAGFVYAQTGDTEMAEASFLKALEYDSMMEAANINLALLYGETGRIAEAQKYLEKTLAVNPGNPVAAFNLAIILTDTDTERALELSRISVKNGGGAEKYNILFNLLQGKISDSTGK